MPFSPAVKEDALVRSRRCCCICHRFAGRYVDVHHIKPEADGGTNTLENAVVLCLECHGQAGHYNPRHPIGNKFKPSEIIRHRDTWWEWCSTNADAPLPHDPITISPSNVVLPPYSKHIGGEVFVPFEIELHNCSKVPLYSIWTRLPLSEANVEESDLRCERSIGPVSILPKYVQEPAGRVTLRLKGGGGGLPNYNFNQTAILAATSTEGAIAYLGISRLHPDERRTFAFRILQREPIRENTLPIRLASFSQTSCTWLLEQNHAFILDFTIPEASRFRNREFHISLLSIDYQKRD